MEDKRQWGVDAAALKAVLGAQWSKQQAERERWEAVLGEREEELEQVNCSSIAL